MLSDSSQLQTPHTTLGNLEWSSVRESKAEWGLGELQERMQERTQCLCWMGEMRMFQRPAVEMATQPPSLQTIKKVV